MRISCYHVSFFFGKQVGNLSIYRKALHLEDFIPSTNSSSYYFFLRTSSSLSRRFRKYFQYKWGVFPGKDNFFTYKINKILNFRILLFHFKTPFFSSSFLVKKNCFRLLCPKMKPLIQILFFFFPWFILLQFLKLKLHRHWIVSIVPVSVK